MATRKPRMDRVTLEKKAADEKLLLLSYVGRIPLYPKEEAILGRLYGLLGYNKQTLAEVAKHFYVTKPRIKQIEEQAFNRIRNYNKGTEELKLGISK